MVLLALSAEPLRSQLRHGSFSVKDFHRQEEEHYFDYFWFLKLSIFFFFRHQSRKALCVLSTSDQDCARRRQKSPVKRSLVLGPTAELAPGSGLCLGYPRWLKHTPSCIWPIMQSSITRGNSFFTPAGEKLCLGAQDGHAL